MEVVGHTERAELDEAIRHHRADVVLLGLDNGELPEVCTGVLDEFPGTLIVGLAADGRRAAIHVDNIGPDGLLDMIRVAKSEVEVRGMRPRQEVRGMLPRRGEE